MTAIIDFGVSNVASVSNMIKRVGGKSCIINNPSELQSIKTNKIILPGVGSFDAAMTLLKNDGWIDQLDSFISNPNNIILGICLGMQIMFEGSEEGGLSGLSWVKGSVTRFHLKDKKLKIPHMGWNIVTPRSKKILFPPTSEEKRFYFVHSYYVHCEDNDDIAAKCNYGDDFTCAIEKGNILGVQFHPEKSHRFGMAIMKAFIQL